MVADCLCMRNGTFGIAALALADAAREDCAGALAAAMQTMPPAAFHLLLATRVHKCRSRVLGNKRATLFHALLSSPILSMWRAVQYIS